MGRVLLSGSPHGDRSAHTDVFADLLRKTYLSDSTRLFICFVLRGMECILGFISFGEGEASAGGEGGRVGVKPCSLLAGGGDGSGRGTDPFCRFLSPPVANPDGKTPKGATDCHALGRTFQCPNVSQLRPGLHRTGRSSPGPGDLSFLPTFFFPSSKLSLSPPPLYTCTFFPSLSRVPPPFPSLSIQLASKRKPFSRGGGSP